MSATPRIADHPARILVVDDEPDNLEVMDLVLAWEGFVIVTAGSGAEALASVAAAPPDLVLLDVMMPGMNGYEVVATMRQDVAARAIPVMLVSAYSDAGARARGVEAGADDFLAKPLERLELVRRVKALLRKAYDDYRED